MKFLLSDEHLQFRDLLRDFFSKSFAGEKLKKFLIETRTQQVTLELKIIWDEFSELGAISGGVTESCGGLGLGFLNHVILVSEAARFLAPLPILETLYFGVLPLEAILLGPDLPNKTELSKDMESLILGESVAAGFLQKDIISKQGDVLFFEKRTAHCRASLAGVEFAQATSTGAELIRGSRLLEQVPNYEILGKIPSPRTLELSRLVLVAAELVSVARAAEETTLEFVKTRKQFGVAIGTFQVLQHKLADIRVKLDSAESLLNFAGWAKDNSTLQFEESALSCFLHARQVSKEVIEDCLQLHGGMGFTWECNIHLYLRRVLSTALWCDDANKLAIELTELEKPPSVGYQ